MDKLLPFVGTYEVFFLILNIYFGLFVGPLPFLPLFRKVVFIHNK